MNKYHFLLPMFNFSLGSSGANFTQRNVRVTRANILEVLPLPALAKSNADPGPQPIPLHCPQSEHVLQATEIGKRLLGTVRDTPWPVLFLLSLKKMD